MFKIFYKGYPRERFCKIIGYNQRGGGVLIILVLKLLKLVCLYFFVLDFCNLNVTVLEI